jgi:hypothetical protein
MVGHLPLTEIVGHPTLKETVGHLALVEIVELLPPVEMFEKNIYLTQYLSLTRAGGNPRGICLVQGCRGSRPPCPLSGGPPPQAAAPAAGTGSSGRPASFGTAKARRPLEDTGRAAEP